MKTIFPLPQKHLLKVLSPPSLLGDLKNGGSSEDKDNLITFLQKLQKAFKPRGWIVTAAMPGNEDLIKYNIASFYKHLDYVHLMAFNFAGKWNDYTGHQAAVSAYE